MIQEWLESLHFAQKRSGDEKLLERFGAVERTGGGASDPTKGPVEGHRLQFEDVMDAIRGGGSPAIDGREARKSVEIILAIYESARQDRPVTIPE